MVNAEAIAAAFGLDRPTGPLIPVQHTVSRTWRLDTTGGSFLVKEVWPDVDPPWASQLVWRREWEERAVKAGVAAPVTVPALDPAYGWTGRVKGRGAYRVTEWLAHRPITAADDLSDWLGQTLATLHSLQRYDGVLEPHFYISDPEVWRNFADRAVRQQRSWAQALRHRLADYLAITERLRATFFGVGDHVVTHRDVILFNVLLTPRGPVLIDWEVVGPDSASLETGYAAVSFGFGDIAYIRRILDSYVAHGGTLVAGLGENLFAHRLGSKLGNLAAMIETALSGGPLTGWRSRYPDADSGVRDLLDEVPALAERLAALARDLDRR